MIITSEGINIHVYPSNYVRESRIFRLTKSLAASGTFKDIRMIGINDGDLPDVEAMDAQRRIVRVRRSTIYSKSPFLGRALGTLHWSWAVWRATRDLDISCINAHSLPVLPLCVALKWRHKAKLVYDTHELETETIISRGLRKRLSKLMEHILIRFADHVFCVGDKIADWYQTRYRILRPTVVRNTPDFQKNAPAVIPMRARFSIPDDHLVFGYVGLIAQGRGVDELIDVFARTGASRHLVIVGSGPQEEKAVEAAARYANIHHIPAVPQQEVVPLLSGADAGISMDIKGCLSYLYSLPNKFFEYIHAGLPVLTGGMPEQVDIVLKYDIGWTLPLDTAAAAAFIDQLSREEISEKKQNVPNASAHLNWAIEEKALLGAYRTLLAIDRPPV